MGNSCLPAREQHSGTRFAPADALAAAAPAPAQQEYYHHPCPYYFGSFRCCGRDKHSPGCQSEKSDIIRVYLMEMVILIIVYLLVNGCAAIVKIFAHQVTRQGIIPIPSLEYCVNAAHTVFGVLESLCRNAEKARGGTWTIVLLIT